MARAKTLERKRGNGRKPSKKLTRTKLIQEADKAVSLYVRQKYANDDGMVKCYTCGHFVHWKKIHCGHYISRYYKYTRWELDNLRPQCMMCNLWKKGDAFTFRANLVDELGESRVREMERRAKILFKESDDWIAAIPITLRVGDNATQKQTGVYSKPTFT